jgi:hypothetical protein
MMSPIKRDENGVPSGRPIQVATKRLSTGYADSTLVHQQVVNTFLGNTRCFPETSYLRSNSLLSLIMPGAISRRTVKGLYFDDEFLWNA